MPLEMARTFSFFLWGFQLGQKEQGVFCTADPLLCVNGGTAGEPVLVAASWGCAQPEPVL